MKSLSLVQLVTLAISLTTPAQAAWFNTTDSSSVHSKTTGVESSTISGSHISSHILSDSALSDSSLDVTKSSLGLPTDLSLSKTLASSASASASVLSDELLSTSLPASKISYPASTSPSGTLVPSDFPEHGASGLSGFPSGLLPSDFSGFPSGSLPSDFSGFPSGPLPSGVSGFPSGSLPSDFAAYGSGFPPPPLSGSIRPSGYPSQVP
ncbi:unnamed protein product [Ambrosiozyma monospora]|uniref:Unnamed protein product n=1 Tax=Ambrosiozyma monospora TaxID=43982 RepID=A0ACB5TQG6_AMBMO|nr:unnamed protein product [Ambrosiozyma monospora]